MSIATNTTEGEIVLSGDLTGDANFPELRASGVTPGAYALARKVYVDGKGRVTWTGAFSGSEVEPYVPIATSTVKGILSFSTDFSSSSGALSINKATSSVKGIFSVGSGMTVSSGAVALDLNSIIATGSLFGLVKSGTNITNTSGTLSVPDSTSSVKGVFRLNGGLASSSGVVNIDYDSLAATGSVFGFVKNGANITSTDGTLSIADATASVKGLFSISTYLNISSGVVSIDKGLLTGDLAAATGSVFGVVKSGTNITNSSGTLSVPDSTSSVKGVASFSTDDFTVSSGAVSLKNKALLSTANTFTAAQNGSVTSSSPVTTFTPDFQAGTTVTDITLTGDLVINFPTTLAPSGTVVQQNFAIRYNAGTVYNVSISGTYLTNTALSFTNAASSAVDVLSLICTDSVCFAVLNKSFS